jgi:nucleoside-diphosphate-sugar epimerase
LNKIKIAVLGSNGYIGNHLQDFLNLNSVHIIRLSHNDTDIFEKIIKEQPEYLINLAASKATATYEESYIANYLFPLSIYNFFVENNISLKKWVQINSYFQLQIPFGRQDFYSKHKEEFNNLLNLKNKDRKFPVTSLFLPHVTGGNEPQSRLLPQLRNAIGQKYKLRVSHGLQFIPVLGIEDACRGIVQSLDSDLIVCSLYPVWYGSLRELLFELCGKMTKEILCFGEFPDPVDATFPRINFPKNLDGFLPKTQFLQIKNSYPGGWNE